MKFESVRWRRQKGPNLIPQHKASIQLTSVLTKLPQQKDANGRETFRAWTWTFWPGFGPSPQIQRQGTFTGLAALASPPPVSPAGSLGLALASQPALRPHYELAHILDRMWFSAPEQPKTASAESESEDCLRLKWLLARWSGMSRLTFEERASPVGHVHSMILGG